MVVPMMKDEGDRKRKRSEQWEVTKLVWCQHEEEGVGGVFRAVRKEVTMREPNDF